MLKTNQIKNFIHLGPVGSRWRKAGHRGRQGCVALDAVASIQAGEEPPSGHQAIRKNCPGRIFGSTNKCNPIKTDRGTNSAFDLRLTCR